MCGSHTDDSEHLVAALIPTTRRLRNIQEASHIQVADRLVAPFGWAAERRQSVRGYNSRVEEENIQWGVISPKFERGQLKLVLCGSSSRLTVTILGLRSLHPGCFLSNQPTFLYLKVSLSPDNENRIRHKTQPALVENGGVNIHDSFSFNIGHEESGRRLLISAWSKTNDPALAPSFIGCMSFGVRKVVTRQEVIQGWFYFLSEALGRKKHLTAKFVTDSDNSTPWYEAPLKSSTLRVRTIAVHPNNELQSHGAKSHNNVPHHRHNGVIENNKVAEQQSKKRPSGEFTTCSKRRKVARDGAEFMCTSGAKEQGQKIHQDIAVAMAINKLSCEVNNKTSKQTRTPTGRRHVRRKSYSTCDVMSLHAEFLKERSAIMKENRGPMVNSSLACSPRLSVDKLHVNSNSVKSKHGQIIESAPARDATFVGSSVKQQPTPNVVRRYKPAEATLARQRNCASVYKTENSQSENLSHKVARNLSGVPKSTKRPNYTLEYVDRGYHSESTSSTSDDSDTTSSDDEDDDDMFFFSQMQKACEKNAVNVTIANNGKDRKDLSLNRKAQAYKIGAIHQLKTWFNRKPELLVESAPQRPKGRKATPTKSLSSGWLYRYKSAADSAISQKLKRTNSLREAVKKSCECCIFSMQSLQEVLKSKGGLMAFKTFLKGEFSDENLNFWLDCEVYRHVKGQSRRYKMAQKIYSQYIEQESPEEVNIDDETRRTTSQSLSKPDSDTFVAAQQRIFDLMSRDSFRRFQMSQLSQCRCKSN